MSTPHLTLVSTTDSPVARPPRAPRGLSKAARAEWVRLEPLLRQKGTVTDENASLLIAYCNGLALVAELDRELSKAKLILKEVGRIPRPHPAIGARNRAAATCIQLGKRLGTIGNGSAPAPGKGGALDDAYADLGI